MVWEAVEVVSDNANDFAKVDAAVALEGFRSGIRLPLNHPLLDRVCERVKSSYKDRPVACHKIVQGGGQALFVVQFTKESDIQKPTICSDKLGLPAEAKAAFSSWQKTLIELLKSSEGDPVLLGQFVNSHGWLDYRHPKLHEAALQLNSTVSRELGVIIAVSSSCSSYDRAEAIAMMNYSGNPSAALKVAIANLSDPDEGVRNESLRLTSVFSRFLSKNDRFTMIKRYCNLLASPSFFDRNKSLSGLFSVLNLETSLSTALDPSCVAKIRTAAGFSRSEQIGGFARNIVQIIDATAH